MTAATGSRGRSSTMSKLGRFFSGNSSNNNNNHINISDSKNSINGIENNNEKTINHNVLIPTPKHEIRSTSTNSSNSMKTNNTNNSINTANTSLSRKNSKRKTTITDIKHNNLKNFSTHSKESNNDSKKLSSVKSNSSIMSNTSTIHNIDHNTSHSIDNSINNSIDHNLQHKNSNVNSSHSINTANHNINNNNNNSNTISNEINFSRSSSVRTTNGAITNTNTVNNNNSNNNSINNLSNSNYHVRFKVLPDGNHEHHLARVKRQEKLGQMVKDWIGGDDKKRNKAISAVPNIFNLKGDSNLINSNNKNLPPSLFSTYLKDHNNNHNHNNHNSNNTNNSNIQDPKFKLSLVKNNKENNQNTESFFEKYGKCQEIIGRGTFGIIRLSHKKINNKEEQLFAVKEFTRRVNEPDSKYSKRLTYEFCISSSLKHESIINAFDLFKDSKGDYYEVMEYCSGGDLYSLIVAAGKLEYLEADCFFKQIMRAVHYMHNMGVSHRDLKPENILLTQNGQIKVTDFGSSECFKTAWEDEIELSNKIKGSSPYIAPEEFTNDEFDPRFVDVWSCGVIYMAMRTGRQLWKEAKLEDEFFYEYLKKRKCEKGYEPIEMLKRARCRNVIYSILDPIPERRITTLQILNSEWVREINCCTTK